MDISYLWGGLSENDGGRYHCAHCDTTTSPYKTWSAAVHQNNSHGHPVGSPVNYAAVKICAHCGRATFVSPQEEIQIPSQKHGATLEKLPKGIKQLYEEARSCSSVSAYTSAVMAARKLLMNLAVLENAKEGLSFKEYVDYLETNGFVPPKGRQWVDKIRRKGNEANHEIRLMSEQDCADIMKLVEMLLRFNFELMDEADCSTEA